MSLNNSYYCNDNRTVILELQEQGLGSIHLPEAGLSPLVFLWGKLALGIRNWLLAFGFWLLAFGPKPKTQNPSTVLNQPI